MGCTCHIPVELASNTGTNFRLGVHNQYILVGHTTTRQPTIEQQLGSPIRGRRRPFASHGHSEFPPPCSNKGWHFVVYIYYNAKAYCCVVPCQLKRALRHESEVAPPVRKTSGTFMLCTGIKVVFAARLLPPALTTTKHCNVQL